MHASFLLSKLIAFLEHENNIYCFISFDFFLFFSWKEHIWSVEIKETSIDDLIGWSCMLAKVGKEQPLLFPHYTANLFQSDAFSNLFFLTWDISNLIFQIRSFPRFDSWSLSSGLIYCKIIVSLIKN